MAQLLLRAQTLAAGTAAVVTTIAANVMPLTLGAIVLGGHALMARMATNALDAVHVTAGREFANAQMVTVALRANA